MAAAWAAVFNEPEDAGLLRKCTLREQPRRAAIERLSKRARSGTESGPPARNETGMPNCWAAKTAETAEPGKAPAPEEENCAKI